MITFFQLPFKALVLMTTLASPSMCDSYLSHASAHTSTLQLRGGVLEKTKYLLSSIINTVFFADTNLIIDCQLSAAWRANVDDQKRRGLTIYVTKTDLKECSFIRP
jgi:hypothetical protein